jgi:predicted Zn finger-like uncharacterized protein
METIEIFGIEEERLLGILSTLPNLWKERKDSLGSSLELLFDKFGNKDDLLFAVQAFTHPGSTTMIVLLTEYLRDLQTAAFIIYAYDFNVVGGVRNATWSGRRLRDILEDCIEVDLSAFSRLRGDEIFVCPKCSAQYRLRAMRITRDGRVECQNCGRIVEYSGLQKNEDAIDYSQE